MLLRFKKRKDKKKKRGVMTTGRPALLLARRISAEDRTPWKKTPAPPPPPKRRGQGYAVCEENKQVLLADRTAEPSKVFPRKRNGGHEGGRDAHSVKKI